MAAAAAAATVDTRCITYLKTMAWPQAFSDNVLPEQRERERERERERKRERGRGDTFPDSL